MIIKFQNEINCEVYFSCILNIKGFCFSDLFCFWHLVLSHSELRKQLFPFDWPGQQYGVQSYQKHPGSSNLVSLTSSLTNVKKKVNFYSADPLNFKWKYPIKLRIEIIPHLSSNNLLRKNKLQIKTNNVNESYYFFFI